MSAQSSNKFKNDDFWTHHVENTDGKIIHVVHKNNIEVLREEQEAIQAKLKRPHYPNTLVNFNLVLDYFNGRQIIHRFLDKPIEAQPLIEKFAYSIITLEDIRADHQVAKINQWETSNSYRNLKFRIKDINSDSKVPITNIVYLSVGSFHRYIDNQNEQRSRMWEIHRQFLVLNTVRSKLKNSQNIKCIVQDPGLSSLDKEFLGLHGYEVVEDPVGFAAINSGTLVYMICPPWCLGAIISQSEWPAAFITDEATANSKDPWFFEMHRECESQRISRNTVMYRRTKPVVNKPSTPPSRQNIPSPIESSLRQRKFPKAGKVEEPKPLRQTLEAPIEISFPRQRTTLQRSVEVCVKCYILMQAVAWIWAMIRNPGPPGPWYLDVTVSVLVYWFSVYFGGFSTESSAPGA